MTALTAEGTALTISRLASIVGMDPRDKAECVTRFRKGEQSYGYGSCLRQDGAKTCWHCGKPRDKMHKFCPECGKQIAPYRTIAECREELQDAFNQTAITVQREEYRADSAEVMILAQGITAMLHTLRLMESGEHSGDAG